MGKVCKQKRRPERVQPKLTSQNRHGDDLHFQQCGQLLEMGLLTGKFSPHRVFRHFLMVISTVRQTVCICFLCSLKSRFLNHFKIVFSFSNGAIALERDSITEIAHRVSRSVWSCIIIRRVFFLLRSASRFFTDKKIPTIFRVILFCSIIIENVIPAGITAARRRRRLQDEITKFAANPRRPRARLG